jgi:SAM-dependent methyltransferase
MNPAFFLCPICNCELNNEDHNVICRNCNKVHGTINQDVIIFNGCIEKTDFFEKQSAVKLSEKYINYSYDDFLQSLNKRELFNMDLLNKKIGITKKLWWEDHIGLINNKDILEVGCGVNYFVPYWVHSGNNVTAFDLCEESVFLTKSILSKIGLFSDKVTLFVGDAEKIIFNKKYDLINISNVLHHIDDKETVLQNLRKCLKLNGKLLIVEPNYYYPLRWIIETDALDPLNFIKNYFQRNSLIEEGEKAIIFSELKNTLNKVGFKIDVNLKDPNYLGYGTIYFLDNNPWLVKMIYNIDKYLFNKILPRILTPFEYLILSDNS